MAIRNLKDGSKKPWLCECYPNGRTGKRVRKKFATKGEAAAFERFTMKEIEDKPWAGDKPDDRRLSQLIELWFDHYGATLANGPVIKSKFLKMAKAMGNPVASTFSPKDYSEFRSLRMAGSINFVDSRWQKGPNPLEEVKPFKDHERTMAFLQKEQITTLLEHVSNHTRTDMLKIVKLCLSTGARWNEAAQLKGSQLSKYKVTFTNTKTKKNRSVPITEELYHEIYKPTSGKLFEECYTPFCYILKNKLGIELPSGQASHVLRHTFASHFMMNGGNILVLRDILGHADISMTMRYAHFAPDHLSEAITHNPITNL